MARILFLATDEITRDPRIRRAVWHAASGGHETVGICRRTASPIPLPGLGTAYRWGRITPLRFPERGPLAQQHAVTREIRGLMRLARLAWRTGALLGPARNVSEVDVVHANDFETLPAGWIIARRHGARLVYDAHEIYTEQEPHGPKAYRAIARRLESFFARRADATITVSQPIASDLRTRLGLNREPYVVLNAPARDGRAVKPSPSPVRAIYQGGPGPGRRIEDIFDAAPFVEGATLAIRVSTADIDRLRAEASKRGLDGLVEILDPVPADRILDGLRDFSIGLIINRPVTLNDELVFPNKLFEYMMAGLATVAPALPGLAPLIDAEGVGVTFEPGNPEALGRALTELAADRPALDEMRLRARDAAVQRFNAEAQLPALAAAWGL